ncbi:MAG TPA: histidine kinase, partial [Candidatus Pelethocola excrementipullorum]|nr:histidine kinase [Candidatus Pelethocola excrementipullorum]
SIYCLIALSLAVFVVLYYLNRSILEPLEGLYKEMQKVKEGNKKLKVPAEFGKDEIGNLFRQFYDMVEQINLLEEEMIAREKEKRTLEIETLQAQINPHFLYNTINAIKMLLRMRRIEEASTALTALVDILKSTLWYSNQTVTLEHEIQFINSYIFIQKLRYDNFQFIINIPAELRAYKVMRFLIQPFIENCFLHGFDEINKDTVIEVTALKKDDHLEIWIIDNGMGMPESTINRILTEKNKRQGLNGIGIGNVIKRINQNYGERYRVDILSTPKEGTRICLILPLLIQGED